MAVLVIASDEIIGRPFIFEPLKGNEANLGATFGEFLAKADDKNSLMILLPDSYNGNPQPLLASMASKAGFHPAIGAGSTENGAAGATYQLCGDKLASNSIAGAYLSGDFRVTSILPRAASRSRAPMMITKAESNLIHEIDGRPALEAFARVLRGPLAEDLRRALMVLFVGVPADRRENSVAPGKYLVRNIIGLDPEKGGSRRGRRSQRRRGDDFHHARRPACARRFEPNAPEASATRSAGKSLRSDYISIVARAAVRSTAFPASTRLIFARRSATCR